MTKGDRIRQLLNCVCAQTRVAGLFTKYIIPLLPKESLLGPVTQPLTSLAASSVE